MSFQRKTVMGSAIMLCFSQWLLWCVTRGRLIQLTNPEKVSWKGLTLRNEKLMCFESILYHFSNSILRLCCSQPNVCPGYSQSAELYCYINPDLIWVFEIMEYYLRQPCTSPPFALTDPYPGVLPNQLTQLAFSTASWAAWVFGTQTSTPGLWNLVSFFAVHQG